MNNFLEAVRNWIIGTTALLSAAISAVSPTPAPSPSSLPQISNQENVVTRSGQYTHKGYTLGYTLSVPKEGGEFSGSFNGTCEGPITGQFEGGEGGKIEGEAEARCKVAVFSYDLNATYKGKLYLNEGKAEINWEGEIPFTLGKGSFAVNFDPTTP